MDRLQFNFIKVMLVMTLGMSMVCAQQQVNQSQNQIEQTQSSPRCRPDQVLTEGKCVQLRKSVSDMVREILENSDGSSTFLHYQASVDATSGAPTIAAPENVPVSDLFIQNLAVISEANMSSCLSLATCKEHCLAWPDRNAEQKKHEQAVLEKFIPPPGLTMEPSPMSGKSKDDIVSEDDDGSGPDFVRTIMLASRKGIDLAKNASSSSSSSSSNWTSICGQCDVEYSGCGSMQYDYTTRINAIYRQLVEKNATLYEKAPETNRNLNPEVLYYHYSMRFLDLANLTSCYAQVSCENSCSIYKSTIADESVELVGPPPNVSPFLRGDTNKPKAIDTIHHGALIGYKLATGSGDCDMCSRHYKDCTVDRYEIARASSNIFG
ncbi:hypothetical protein TYRP_012473 [Tyrophagus putrescentiae]|nr:hypothetical protein TYRP_012473 [Tyrophagus putrescentiae]